MNFQPDLVVAILDGRKTVTRRMASENPRSPWYEAQCSYRPGREYALCPGRGKTAMGRIRIKHVQLVQLGSLTDEEARREGFSSAVAFSLTWARMHRGYSNQDWVWRVEFELVPVERLEMAA